MPSKPVDTAIVMVVGPCIDDTDFKSIEEAIAYDAAGMDVSLIVEKTDGTTSVTAIALTTGGTSDWTHKDGGYYEVEITAVQNAEEGVGYVRGICDGVLPFESSHYDIVAVDVYNAMIKGSEALQVDITKIGGVAQSLTDFKDMVDTGYDPITHKIQSDLIYIHGTALAETDGQLAAAFKKLFDVATPLLVASVAPDAAGTAATLHGITDGKVDVVDTVVDAIKAKTDNLPSGVGKNEAFPKFDFLMVLSSDHVTGAGGKTVTGEISKDGGSFAAITNAISEVSDGMYVIADGFTQTEMNADTVTLKFTADNCDARVITFITS